MCKFCDYQEGAAKFATEEISVAQRLVGLMSEVGELAQVYDRLWRKSEKSPESCVEFREQIQEELGDILWYVAQLATTEGFDLQKIAHRNLTKLVSRNQPKESRT